MKRGGHDLCELRHTVFQFVEGGGGGQSVLFWQYLCAADYILQKIFQHDNIIAVWHYMIRILTADVKLTQGSCSTMQSHKKWL